MGFGEGCCDEQGPKPKRIRRAVERYGFETKNFISRTTCVDKSEECNTARGSRAKMRNRRRTKHSKISRRKSRTSVQQVEEVTEEDTTLKLTDLSEEVLLLILERVPAFGLINLSKTSTQFHRLCLMDTIWKQRCKVTSRFLFHVLILSPTFSNVFEHEIPRIFSSFKFEIQPRKFIILFLIASYKKQSALPLKLFNNMIMKYFIVTDKFTTSLSLTLYEKGWGGSETFRSFCVSWPNVDVFQLNIKLADRISLILNLRSYILFSPKIFQLNDVFENQV